MTDLTTLGAYGLDVTKCRITFMLKNMSLNIINEIILKQTDYS